MDRTPSILLLDYGSRSYPISIVDPEIEQREIAYASLQLQPDPDSPNIFDLEGRLLPDKFCLFQGTRAQVLTIASMVASASD